MATIIGLVFPEEKKKGKKDAQSQKGDKEHGEPDEAEAAAEH